MFGLTTKIHGYILTRDSLWILWGKIVGGATVIATTLADPTFKLIDVAWLISDLRLHQLQALSALILVISAKLSNSPLPSKSDADKVSLPVKEQV